ncbi:MAG TPA: hypothetical protein VFA26_05270 [Gemmataceae bacterium]|nr:hypothetical protein [Gemmataceae bacterium]
MRRILLLAPVARLVSLVGGPLALACVAGCQSTPGFHWALSVTKPPVLSQPAAVSPVEAPPVAYAVEQPSPWPVYGRRAIRAAAGVATISGCEPCPPCPPGAAPSQPPTQPQAGPPRAMPRGPAEPKENNPE